MTPSVLLESVPKTVMGVVAIATFASAGEMRSAMQMREVILPPNSSGPLSYLAPGPLAAVIGREFLVPDDPEKSEDYLLQTAVDIAGEAGFQRKRAAYWRWQRAFLDECTVLDQQALDQAIQEMQQLIEEEKAEARKSKVRLGVSFGFAAGAAAIGMSTPPLAPIAVTAGFMSVGGWAIDHLPGYFDRESNQPKPSAMCVSAQREFGWKA